MAKMYTLDQKLLTETPELRIGDKVYSVNNSTKTVKKIHEVTKNVDGDNFYTVMDKVLEMTVGAEAAKDISAQNMPYPAYQQLFELVMAAVTGEDLKTEKST